ncbi:TPA: hypothetical protein ACQVIB_004228, partial [Serratia marcescens]
SEKAPFIASASPQSESAASRFNNTPIVIPRFFERLYVLAKRLSAMNCAGNACVFNLLNNRCAKLKISADFSR